MKELKDFPVIEEKISEKKGSVCLFSLLQPKDGDYWDLVIGADWITAKKIEDVKFVVALLEKYLPETLNKKISAVILLHSNEVFVENFLNIIRDANNPEKLLDFKINGAGVKEAYLIKPTPRAKSLNDRLISLLEQLSEEKQEQLISLLGQLLEEQQEQLISLLEQLPEKKQEQLISLLKQPPEGQHISEPMKNNVIDAKERFSKDNRVSQEDKFKIGGKNV